MHARRGLVGVREALLLHRQRHGLVGQLEVGVARDVGLVVGVVLERSLGVVAELLDVSVVLIEGLREVGAPRRLEVPEQRLVSLAVGRVVGPEVRELGGSLTELLQCVGSKVDRVLRTLPVLGRPVDAVRGRASAITCGRGGQVLVVGVALGDQVLPQLIGRIADCAAAFQLVLEVVHDGVQAVVLVPIL